MRQKIQTPYGKITIYSKVGHEVRASVVVVPGFSESITHSEAVVNALAARGYAAFTFRQPRKAADSDPIGRLANILHETINSDAIKAEKVHAVAHSLGSASLLKVTQKNPAKIASLTLMQPPGMNQRQAFTRLALRTGQKTLRNAERTLRNRHLYKFTRQKDAASDRPSPITTRRFVRAQLSSAFIIAKNPLLAIREARAAAHYDIAPDIAKVKQLGIPVHIIEAHDDELFGTERGDEELIRIADLDGAYFSISDRRASHDAFWMQPAQTAQIIDVLVGHST